MQIQITNGAVDIPDIIPRSIAKWYIREITLIGVRAGVADQSEQEIKKNMEEDKESLERGTSSFFELEDLKEELTKKCITSVSIRTHTVADLSLLLDNYTITPDDIEKISSICQEKIKTQEAKKKDIETTLSQSTPETSES